MHLHSADLVNVASSVVIGLSFRRVARSLAMFIVFILYHSVTAVLAQSPSGTASTVQPSTNARFPATFNVAEDRPIASSPSSSTCGIQTVDGYCDSSTLPSSIASCQLDTCSQSCPYRSATPSYINLLSASSSTTACSSADYVNVRPGSSSGSGQPASTLFVAAGGQGGSQPCFVAPTAVPVLGSGGSFTLSFWAWPSSNSIGLVSV
jgi:hypothetical protein